VNGTLLAPIPRPGKVICIGLNYRDHAAESGAEIPSEPVCFSKFSQAIIGPEAAIILPPVANKVDYEAELVVVVGRRGKFIAERDARAYVAGYMNGNDVSARDWQLGRPGGQWLLGKTPDTFAPTGPYLVTADEVADPQQLAISLTLNGETMQTSNTRELIFGIDRLVSHLSQLITLEPGDVIFTGTPPGVGQARKPPVFLKPGDTVEVQIEGLGVLTNAVRAV
jgi:2-keto-4-pentenoate hydratase/2-oxohepta-3-ene-1,7-dioic acid hydratase in catechol pathway